MKHYIIFLLIIFSQLLASCSEENFAEEEAAQLVVEGWIDAGDYPIVMLSKTIPASNIKYDELKDYIIRWGKVTISDGENEVILTGRKSDKHFPPYIYTTTKMIGEAGKTYYLTAEYKNESKNINLYATAQTTIPPKIEAERIVAEYNNGIYSVGAIINDNPNEKNYYKCFVRVIGRDNDYLSSNLSIINDEHTTFPYKIPIEAGKSSVYEEFDRYSISEQNALMIKVAQIDSVAYNFWDDYKNMMELGQNPFFRYSSNIRSNISGGLGYWIGYGATEYLCKPYKHNEPIKLK